MYMLVPNEPYVDFVSGRGDLRRRHVARLSPVTRPAGLACSTPPCWLRCGSSTEELLAGLLLFRLLYYIMPFALALVILGVRELLLGRAARRIAAKETAQ